MSVYHGPKEVNATASMVLGGYYDAAKVGDELFTLETSDPFNQTLSGSQTNNVNVTGLEVNVDGSISTGTFGETDVGMPVLVDTGEYILFFFYRSCDRKR